MSTLKVLICGDGAIGKTCLLDTLCEKDCVDWDAPEYKPTASDNLQREWCDADGDDWEISLWDTAGQEALINLRKNAYPGTEVLLIAFDMTKGVSLENVPSWVDEVAETEENIGATILVGTKSDYYEELQADLYITDSGCMTYGSDGQPLKTMDEMFEMAVQIGAAAFVCTSAKNGYGTLEAAEEGPAVCCESDTMSGQGENNYLDLQILRCGSLVKAGGSIATVKFPSCEVKVKAPSCEVKVKCPSCEVKVKGPSCGYDYYMDADGKEVVMIKAPSLDMDTSSDEDEDEGSKRSQMAKKLNLTDLDLEELFSYFDADGSGGVDPEEFGTLLAACGLPLQESMVDAIVKQIDVDHDGKIDLEEFAGFFLSRDWGFDTVNMSEEDHMRFVTGQKNSSSKLGDFEWDFTKSYDQNLEKMNSSKRATKLTGSGDTSDLMERNRKMLMFKLLLPLWIKQATRHINASGAEDVAGRSQNSFTAQVGHPEQDKAYIEGYWKASSAEEFAGHMKPPNDKCGVCGTIDFSIREEASVEHVTALANACNKLFQEIVMPMIRSTVSDIPKELIRTGMINGSVFDSISFKIVKVDGKRLFRICGFSGVDVTALFKDVIVDLDHLLADVSLKVSTGFGLSDLTSEGTTPLKDMLSGKVELNVSWHVKLAEIAARITGQVWGLILADETDSRRQLKSTQERCNMFIAGCKFFEAQRSLLFFQFNSVFDVVCEVIKSIAIPALYENLHKCNLEGILDEPPSPERIDAVFEAVGNISGKTFAALRKHLINDVHLCPGGSGTLITVLVKLKKEINEYLVERCQKNSAFSERAMSTRWALEGIRLYFQAQESLSGFEGLCCINKVFQMGLDVKGLGDLFKLLPSMAEYNAAEIADEHEEDCFDTGIPEFVPYARFLHRYLKMNKKGGKDAEPVRPSDEYLNELREDFSEVIEIAKAAMPMLEHVHMEATEMGEGGAVWMNKAEQEAKWMFGMIDEDLATAEFEKFVSSGQSLKVKGPSVKYPSCEVKVKGPSYMMGQY